MYLYPFVYFHIHAMNGLFKQYFKMKLYTRVTKYTDILIFDFAHIIHPQRCNNATLKR